MGRFTEKSMDAGLPDPRLNPLLNPTLGQNLGRWAQVYFTNPPEKRDGAVVELLRELEGTPTESVPTMAPGPKTIQPEERVDVNPPEVIECPACRRENPGNQSFCGSCGTALHSAAIRPSPQVLSAEQNPTPSVPAAAMHVPFAADNELQWLRERVPGEDAESGQSGVWKYALLFLIMIAAVVGYFEWASRPSSQPAAVSSASSSDSTSQTSESQTDTPQPPTVLPSDSPAQANPATDNALSDSSHAALSDSAKPSTKASKPANDKPAGKDVPSHQPLAAAAERSPIEPNAQEETPSGSGSGSPELKEAQRLLHGGAAGDNAEAAKLLWKAVGKQNIAASILLADLYMRGAGVSKNCEQARLLLVAAAKKSDAAAGEKLRNLENSGCQ